MHIYILFSSLAIYLETAPTRIKEAAKQKREKLLAIANAEAGTVRFDDTKFLDESEELIDDLKRIVGESFSFSMQDDYDDDEVGTSNNSKVKDEGKDTTDGTAEPLEENERPSIELGQPVASSSKFRKPKIAAFFEDEADSSDDDSEVAGS